MPSEKEVPKSKKPKKKSPAKKSQPNKKKEIELEPGCVRTKRDLALALRKSVRTIGYWITDGMPVLPDGNYHIADVLEWHISRNQKPEKETPEWEKILNESKAERAQIELQKIKGDLVNKHEYEREQIKKIVALKRALLTLPKKISMKIVGLNEKRTYEILNHEIKMMIKSFAGREGNG